MSPDFLGKGIAWPMRLNERKGIAVSRSEDKIKESIRIILGTERGTRLMRPTFGSLLHTLVFAPNNIGTANLARHYVEDALTTWEPRIVLDQVTVENKHQINGCRSTIVYRSTSVITSRRRVTRRIWSIPSIWTANRTGNYGPRQNRPTQPR